MNCILYIFFSLFCAEWVIWVILLILFFLFFLVHLDSNKSFFPKCHPYMAGCIVVVIFLFSIYHANDIKLFVTSIFNNASISTVETKTQHPKTAAITHNFITNGATQPNGICFFMVTLMMLPHLRMNLFQDWLQQNLKSNYRYIDHENYSIVELLIRIIYYIVFSLIFLKKIVKKWNHSEIWTIIVLMKFLKTKPWMMHRQMNKF